jgi:hypothetical protein
VNNESINIGNERISQRFRIGIVLELETIIIILIGTALRVLEEGGL